MNIDPDGRRDIYIGGLADKNDTRIVQGYAGGQQNLHQDRDIQYFSYKEKAEITAAINAPLKDGEPLNVTGHSLGAREAIKQANSTEAKITNLVTIDPVGSAGNGAKPANTENWVNVTAKPATSDFSDKVASVGRKFLGTTNTSGATTAQTSTAHHGYFDTMMSQVKAADTIDASYQDSRNP